MGDEHKDEQDAVTLKQQLVEANVTIAVLTEQLKVAKVAQQKLEDELEEAHGNSSPHLMTELAVAHDRLNSASERQSHLEKELADACTRAPQLETKLAVAKEQLKAFDDRLKAARIEHQLQMEKQELQLESMKEKYELQLHNVRIRCSDFNVKVADADIEPSSSGTPTSTSGDELVKSNSPQDGRLLGPSEKLYLAPMMLTPDTSHELICVAFITGSSREAIDEKVQRLKGQIVPGARAILVESEAEADSIKQTIVNRGHTLVKRKRHDNPQKLNVGVEFYNEPNKLCTRHADDEVTAREEFLALFRLPFTPLDELVEQIAPLPEISTSVEHSPKSVPRMPRSWRLPVRVASLRIPQRFVHS